MSRNRAFTGSGHWQSRCPSRPIPSCPVACVPHWEVSVSRRWLFHPDGTASSFSKKTTNGPAVAAEA